MKPSLIVPTVCGAGAFAGGGGGGGGGIPNAIPATTLNFTAHPYDDPTNWDSARKSPGVTWYQRYAESGSNKFTSGWCPVTGGAGCGDPEGGFASASTNSYRVKSLTDNKWMGFEYKPWNAAGLEFDKSKGIRVMALLFYDDTGTHKANGIIGVGSWANPDDFIQFYGDFKNCQGVFREYQDLTQLDSNDYFDEANKAVSAGHYFMLRMELPPGLTGTATCDIQSWHTVAGYRYSDFGNEFTMVGDWSEVTLDTFYFRTYWWDTPNKAYSGINFAWVGTADDAWPV